MKKWKPTWPAALIGMVVADPSACLLTVCENGYGKRTRLDEYRAQSRGGLGLIDVKTTDKTGPVVAIKPVSEGMDLMLITAQGMIIRTGLDDIRTIGRNTQGVRLIKLNDGDRLLDAGGEVLDRRRADVDSRRGQDVVGVLRGHAAAPSVFRASCSANSAAPSAPV